MKFNKLIVAGLIVVGTICLSGCSFNQEESMSDNVKKIGQVDDYTKVYKLTDTDTGKKYIIVGKTSVSGGVSIIDIEEDK